MPAMSKKYGDSEGNQKSGHRTSPVDWNGSLSKRSLGSKTGMQSESRNKTSSNEENKMDMILYWYFSILTLLLPSPGCRKTSCRTTQRVLSAGSMIPQICGSHSSCVERNSSTGRVDPVKRSMRMDTNATPRYWPPAVVTIPRVFWL